MMSKNERVKEEIIGKAQTLFRRFGLKKTTMDEIAEICGKSKSTLYHYFKSKEEVFDSVVDRELRSLRMSVKAEVEKQKTVQDKLKTYFVQFHSEILSRITLYSFVHEEVMDIINKEHYTNKLIDFETNYVLRILEDSFDSGEIKSMKKEDMPWIAKILIAAFFGIVQYSIEGNKGIDTEKIKLATETLVPTLFR